MKFEEKLIQLRKARGLSQEALAEQLGVSRQAVSRWELGETTPDLANLKQLSELYGVSADYLIHDEYESDEDLPKVKEKSNMVYVQKVRILKYCGRMTVISAILTFVMLIIFSLTKMPVFLGIAAGQALFSVVFCILYYVARFNLANYIAEQQ